MEIDLEKLNEEKKANFKERLSFVKFWAEYIKNHDENEWSEQQRFLIDSQFEK